MGENALSSLPDLPPKGEKKKGEKKKNPLFN